MDFKEYQEKAMGFAVYEDEQYPLLGLPEEVGELLGIFAKHLRGDDLIKRYGSHGAMREAILKEAGDVLWQLTALLKEVDMTLQDAAELNIQKLTDRQARGVIQGSGDNR